MGSLFDGFGDMQLVRTGPSLRERVEHQVTLVHHLSVIARLRQFRQGLEGEMHPESWLRLEAPLVVTLSDVCDALDLDEQERATVLGDDGVMALVNILESHAYHPPAYRRKLPMNERQALGLRYAREHGTITLSLYKQICPYWSDETLRLDLANLTRRGLLAKNGANRGTCYTLVGGVGDEARSNLRQGLGR